MVNKVIQHQTVIVIVQTQLHNIMLLHNDSQYYTLLHNESYSVMIIWSTKLHHITPFIVIVQTQLHNITLCNDYSVNTVTHYHTIL